MRSTSLPLPASSELRACGLAALAEAGLVSLPAHVLLTESGAFGADIELFALPFLAAYVVGAVLACRFRTSRNLAGAAALLAVLAGVTLGRGGIDRTAFAVIVALLVSVRVVALAFRDWRTPLSGELWWGAALLGAEVALSAGPMPEWRPLLVVFVPLFFAAALTSRATTVWTSGDGTEQEAGASWAKRTILATGALAAAMATTAVVAVRGGLLDGVGAWLRPVLAVVGAALLFLVVQATRPLFWLADRIGLDPERFREVLRRLRDSLAQGRPRAELAPPTPSPWHRIVGLIVFALVGYAIYRLLRRRRPEVDPERTPRETPTVVEATPLADRDDAPPRWRFRPELPAEAVRRLYAEVLLDLRGRALPKDPWLTPAEFVPQVAAAFPDGAQDFEALTRAYEDVRYGGLRLERRGIRDLEVRQRRLLAIMRRAGRGAVGGSG